MSVAILGGKKNFIISEEETCDPPPENKIRNTLDLLLKVILFLAFCLFSHIPRSTLSIRSFFTQDIPPAESPQLMLAV